MLIDFGPTPFDAETQLSTITDRYDRMIQSSGGTTIGPPNVFHTSDKVDELIAGESFFDIPTGTFESMT